MTDAMTERPTAPVLVDADSLASALSGKAPLRISPPPRKSAGTIRAPAAAEKNTSIAAY